MRDSLLFLCTSACPGTAGFLLRLAHDGHLDYATELAAIYFPNALEDFRTDISSHLEQSPHLMMLVPAILEPLVLRISLRGHVCDQIQNLLPRQLI